MTCPCKGCDKRYANCHAECEGYKAYREEMNNKLRSDNRQKFISMDLFDMHTHRYSEVNRKQHLRRMNRT